MVFKKDLRKLFHEKRSQITYDESRKLSKTISELFFDFFDLSKVSSIHIFLPIHHKGEIDTSFIIDAIWRDFPHITTVVPKLNDERTELESLVYTPATLLVKNSWGIPEPSGVTENYPEDKIDLVVLPLLAFDLAGNRVGYGRGFYDHLLSRCKKNILRAGLSFFEAVEKITDVSEADIPLTHCVTPKKVYDFTVE